jgi:glycolate oxidase
VFHAGDGNLHPLILYDANAPGELEKAEALGAAILRLCVEAGGCLTGEHGVGVEKRDLMGVQFSQADLEAQMRVKDVFDPDWLAEPGEGVSAGGECRAAGGVRVDGPRGAVCPPPACGRPPREYLDLCERDVGAHAGAA